MSIQLFQLFSRWNSFIQVYDKEQAKEREVKSSAHVHLQACGGETLQQYVTSSLRSIHLHADILHFSSCGIKYHAPISFRILADRRASYSVIGYTLCPMVISQAIFRIPWCIFAGAQRWLLWLILSLVKPYRSCPVIWQWRLFSCS